MSPPRERKSLDQSLEDAFVYGEPEQKPQPEPAIAKDKSEAKPAKQKAKPKAEDNSIAALVSELQASLPTERTIRFTVDMPESLHKKLSVFAARSGRKKVDIVRAVLEAVLKDVEE